MTMCKHFVVYIPWCISKSNTKCGARQMFFSLQDAHSTQHDQIHKFNTKYAWALMFFPKVLLTFCSDLNLLGVCSFFFPCSSLPKSAKCILYWFQVFKSTGLLFPRCILLCLLFFWPAQQCMQAPSAKRIQLKK